MKKRSLGGLLGVTFVMLFVMPHIVTAQNNNSVVRLIRYQLEFSERDLAFSQLMGYDVAVIKDADVINNIGKPMMPVKEIKIALPRGLGVKSVNVVATKSIEIMGEYNIFPAQPPLRISQRPEKFIEPQLDVYNSTEPYPGNLAEFSNMTDLAGQGMAVIQLYPLQYIPKEKRLTLYTTLTLVLECEEGYRCGDYLPQNISESGRKTYEQTVKGMVINPEDVRLNTAPDSPSSGRALPAGDYDHVVITSTSNSSYFQPLVTWHTRRGLKDTVVTTTWIYANYTGDNQQKIRSFVIDANSTWGTQYFLIGGEDETVPFEYYTYYDQYTPSDQYYSDYDDDWVHEVYVGRATAEGSSEIGCFVNKVLYYEKTPPTTNYPLDVLLIGMDLDASTHSEDLKETIDGYIPPQFNVTKVYDSDPTPPTHYTATMNALNAGQNLVNHADHGSETFMGTGYVNHGWGINNSDVNNLTNNYQMSIVTSLACEVNAMDHSESISERFVIYNSYQAGVAFTGNTRHGWGYIGYPEELSGRLDKQWWKGLFTASQYTLGEAIIYAKHNFPTGAPDADLKRHCEWTFNLLGEPAMPIWTDTPANFVVTHDATLPIGTTSFDVHVDSSGSPVNQAYVCLWKQNDGVYETGYTNAGGNVTLTLTPPPTTTGTMYVTVTKHNYLPDTGYATVISPPEYTLTIYIDPAGSGSVTKDPDLPTYPAGTPVELTASGDLPREFDHWSGGLTGSENPKTITMDGDKTVTAHFVIPGHWINLDSFPMYTAVDGAHSGGAVAQMTLNYIWWDNAVSDTPLILFGQNEVYDTCLVYSDQDPAVDVNGVWKVLQILRPKPYTQFGYNFNKYSSVYQDTMLKRICVWLDYPIGTYGGHEPGYPLHVPGLVPAYGGFTHWLAVRGIHTDQVSYPIPPTLTIYGFWVNDPVTGGIGENTYKTATEFAATYYDSIAVSGDPYYGKYVGVLEPPESGNECRIILARTRPHFTTKTVDNPGYTVQAKSGDTQGVITETVVQAAIDGVTEELIPYDDDFAGIFASVVPGKPLYVTADNGRDYYLVPFDRAGGCTAVGKTGLNKGKGSVVYEDRAMVVVLIDAFDGSFREVSWFEKPVVYLPLSKVAARQLAFEAAEENGIEVGELRDLEPELVYRSESPYYPEWRVVIGGYALFISQNGDVTIEQWIQGMAGAGNTMADDAGSFSYGLTTALPTPFARSTTISYSIAKPGNVLLSVYDINGRLVKTLVNAHKEAGVYRQEWKGCDDDGQRLAPGVYFTRLASGDFVSVKKLILVR